MAKTVYDVLIQKHEEDVDSLIQFLAGGGVKDFAEYREVVGRIRGLRLAIQTTTDLLRSMKDNDDE